LNFSFHLWRGGPVPTRRPSDNVLKLLYFHHSCHYTPPFIFVCVSWTVNLSDSNKTRASVHASPLSVGSSSSISV
jgi:hypothetical protein